MSKTTAQLKVGAPIIILPPLGMSARGGAEIAEATRCDCGEFTTINTVSAIAAHLARFVNKASEGDTIRVNLNGRPQLFTAVRQPPNGFPEMGIHPGWDEGTSERECACDVCGWD